MTDLRRIVNTTINASQYYVQTVPECPSCGHQTTAKVYLTPVWEHVKDDVYMDRTVSTYKTGHRCFACEYEDVREVILTMYITPSHVQFENLVEEMRKWQNEYFKHRTDQALQESKRLEKEVDEHLKSRNQYNLFP